MRLHVFPRTCRITHRLSWPAGLLPLGYRVSALLIFKQFPGLFARLLHLVGSAGPLYRGASRWFWCDETAGTEASLNAKPGTACRTPIHLPPVGLEPGGDALLCSFGSTLEIFRSHSG